MNNERLAARTDDELMRAVARGDANAFDVLFRRHHARTHQLCVHLCRGVADDAVQDTFLKLWRSASTFRGRAKFTTWLYAIARNTCMDHVSRELRITRLHSNAAAGIEELSEDSESDTAAASRAEILAEALQQLPGDLKDALVLRRFHQLPHSEIAAILGCSEGAARVRVHRALERLREIVRAIEVTHNAM